MVNKPNGDFHFENGKFVHNVKCSNKLKYVAASLIAAIFLVSHQPATADLEDSKMARYVNYIMSNNKSLSYEAATDMADKIVRWSDYHEIQPETMLAVAKIESRFNQHAKSPTGSVGLMQIQQRWHRSTIATAKKLTGGRDIFDLDVNAFVGGYVLKTCMTMFKLKDMALRCYNGSTKTKTDYHIKVNREIKQLSI